MERLMLGGGIGHVREVAVELAAVIHANQHVAATVPRDRRPALYIDFEGHYQTTANVKALELAANFRVVDDRLNSSKAYVLLREHLEQSHGPGRWIKPAKGALPLREIANKILHADEVAFKRALYRSDNQDGAGEFANWCDDSTAVLNGRHGNQDWTCEVDLLSFSVCLHELMAYWMEDPQLGERMKERGILGSSERV